MFFWVVRWNRTFLLHPSQGVNRPLSCMCHLLVNIHLGYQIDCHGITVNTWECVQVTPPPFFFFWPCHITCRILVPWPGIEPQPQQWKLQVLTSERPENYEVTLIYLKMDPKHKSGDAGKSDRPKRSFKVLPLREKVKLLYLIRKENLLFL